MDGEQTNPECPGCRSLQKKLATLEAELVELRRIIEELRRAGKRQAGPFSKGPPKPQPKRPGRKPGDDYGTQFSRAEPERIDETHHAELPPACPHCGGRHVAQTHTAEQFQTEVVCQVVQRAVQRAVQALLRRGLAVRDRFALGQLSLQGLAWWRTRLTRGLEELVTPIKSHPANETFAKFLERHLGEVFTFLVPLARTTAGGVVHQLLPAANYLGEQAIRPAVVNRKVWGGNRTDRGASAQGTLSTVLLTALQRTLDPLAWLQRLRESPHSLHLPR